MNSKDQEAINSLLTEIRILKKNLQASNYARLRIETLKDMNQRLLENINAELSLTLAELKTTQSRLNKAKEEAESANKIKSEFLANMSHELRTPLNAIIGYSEMLQEEAEEGGDSFQSFASDLKKISGSAKHLLSLINDVLDLSKIEAGKLEIFLEDINTSDLIKELELIIMPLMEKNNNTFKLNMPANLPIMHTDAVKVRQCLLNLLSNSSKFTKAGVITLDVKMFTLNEKEWIEFSVSDTGIGLTREQLEKLFHAFSQADASTTRKYGGTGLGLFLTQQFCEMLGGKVTAKSKYGEGSTFTMVLPIKSKTGISRSDFSTKLIEGEKVAVNPLYKTILIIDDDPEFHHEMQNILAPAGYNILHALTSDEGLNLAKEFKPDIITLDVIMPGVDGWTILSTLKANSILSKIPVVLITIVSEEELGFALGAFDYIRKPIDADQLLEKIEQTLAKKNSEMIMVINDNTSEQERIKKILDKANFQIVKAANPEEAINLLGQIEPSLILLDLVASNIDELDLINKLQQHKKACRIPALALIEKNNQLSSEEHNLLSKYTKAILQTSEYNYQEFISAIKQNLTVKKEKLEKLPAKEE